LSANATGGTESAAPTPAPGYFPQRFRRVCGASACDRTAAFAVLIARLPDGGAEGAGAIVLRA